MESSNVVSLQVSYFEYRRIRNECDGLLSQSVLNNIWTYFSSYFSTSAQESYLKQKVCEVLFGSSYQNFKDITSTFVGARGGLMEYIMPSDAKIGSTPLIDVVGKINDNAQNMTIIGEAAKFGRLDVVKSLVSKTSLENKNCAPLHQAVIAASKSCSDKNLEIISDLIEGGARVNAVDGAGNTPLHFSLNCFKATEMLVEKGRASLNIWNGRGASPLDEVYIDGFGLLFFPNQENKKIYDYLVEKGAEHGAIKKNMENIKLMCETFFDDIATRLAVLAKVSTDFGYQKYKGHYYGDKPGCSAIQQGL